MVFIPLFALILASSSPCDASRVYAKAFAATGGLSWSRVSEIVADGTITSSGLRGTFHEATDVQHGRYALYTRVGTQSTASVYDGSQDWREDSSRGVHPLDSDNARAAAITHAYLNRNGYFKPHTDPADLACTEVMAESGQTFYDIRLLPRGGLPIEQWMSPTTFLVNRTIETSPTSTVITTLSDYRLVGGIALPFESKVGIVGDPADDSVAKTKSYTLLSTVRERDFLKPPEPTDTHMADSDKSTTVPISVEAGDVVLQASINGKGPFPFLLDTGGHAILTPLAARTIGVTTEGAGSSGGGGSSRVALSYAFLRSIKIGQSEIPSQPVLVIPYDNDFSDRGAKQPLAGILGLELFERFAIRIDYARSEMTMTPLRSFNYTGDGARIPIVFQEDMPLIHAQADGAMGAFGVDTGNSGPLILFGRYLRYHGFLKRYLRGTAATGSGTGGTVHESAHVIRSFAVGGRIFHDVVTEFVVGQQGGSFSSTTEAGNVGYNVLARFVPTFDYRRRLLYLEPAKSGPAPVFGRSGLSLSKTTRNAFTVVGVRRGSPASSVGIAIGDSVTSINGRSARSLGYADYYATIRQPAGTLLTLRILHKGAYRSVRLTLRDLPLPTE